MFKANDQVCYLFQISVDFIIITVKLKIYDYILLLWFVFNDIKKHTSNRFNTLQLFVDASVAAGRRSPTTRSWCWTTTPGRAGPRCPEAPIPRRPKATSSRPSTSHSTPSKSISSTAAWSGPASRPLSLHLVSASSRSVLYPKYTYISHIISFTGGAVSQWVACATCCNAAITGSSLTLGLSTANSVRTYLSCTKYTKSWKKNRKKTFHTEGGKWTRNLKNEKYNQPTKAVLWGGGVCFLRYFYLWSHFRIIRWLPQWPCLKSYQPLISVSRIDSVGSVTSWAIRIRYYFFRIRILLSIQL